MRKTVITVISAVTACLLLPLLSGGALRGTLGGGCGRSSGAPVASPSAGSGRWDSEQLTNVAAIITVGADKNVPSWGWIVAVATALQESGLRNLAGGADDSIGLFQQRPSQGWGTPQQLADPAYQAGKFFDRLLTITGWQQMPLTDAAQAVQRSAYPHAYAKHADTATHLVNQVAAGIVLPATLEQPCAPYCLTPAETTACGNVVTVFARAETWLTAWEGGPVPYLSSGDPADWYDGYRRDCSGYVSMTLGLPGPGLNTAGLAARSTRLIAAQLQPGDLLINTAPNLRGHVVLFERWADSAMTRYWGYEQTGSGGTHHRIIPYPYFGRYTMAPYRFAS